MREVSITRDGNKIVFTREEIISLYSQIMKLYDEEDLEQVCKISNIELTEEEKVTVLDCYNIARCEDDHWCDTLLYFCDEIVAGRDKK